MIKSNRKKWFAYLVIFCMILGMIPSTAFGVESQKMNVNISSVSGMPGSEVQVTVSLDNNPGISSLRAKVSFDKEIVSLKSIEYNTAFGGQAQQPENFNSPVTLQWIDFVKSCNLEDVFATLTFEIKSDAPENAVSEIDFSYDPDDIYDFSETNIPVEVNTGSITVVSCKPGDINGDNQTNNKDATRLFQYLAGYDVEVNEPALDVNGDTKINNKDATRLFQYLADWDVEIFCTGSSSQNCDHEISVVEAKKASCTVDGNIEYWYCTKCKKCFGDSMGSKEITLASTVLKASHNFVNGICTVCGLGDENGYSINYNIANGDEYIAQQDVNNNGNPKSFTGESAVPLEDIAVDGYKFEGWYDSSTGGNRVYSIEQGTNHDVQLYAHWKLYEYEVKFSVNMINDSPGSSEPEKIKTFTYTVDKGATLQPLKMDTYTFVGWSNKNTGKFYKDNIIPAGTTGDIILEDNWVSQRNRAKKVSKLGDPLVVEDTDNSRILFCYEIGTIENVPLYTTQELNCVNGIVSIVEKTTEHSLEASEMKSIGSSLFKETSDSTQFVLSKELTDMTEVSERCVNERGVDKETLTTEAKSQTNTTSFSTSVGGSSENYSYNDSTHQNSTNENFVLNENFAMGEKNELTTSKKDTAELSAGISFPIDIVSFNLGAKATSEYGVTNVNSNYMDYSTGSTHGWDTTTSDSSHSANSVTNSKNWNSTSGSSTAATVSNSTSISEAIHEMISNEYGYGKTYSETYGNSESRGMVSSSGETTDSTSTVAYNNTEIKSHTIGFQTTGNTFGNYRLIMAGTLHVFAVVGYDVAKNDYFVYTYNVLGDGSQNDPLHEIVDYSYDRSFNDYENTVIPFEVPKYVDDYVNSRIINTKGLEYEFNNKNHTAKVDSYNGTDTVVIIPSYMVDEEGTAYKVTGLDSNAFKNNKKIEAISLGRYINVIPDNAFDGCSSLKNIICPGVTEIGNGAFNGCISLNKFTVSNQVTSLGESAFAGVPELTVEVGYDSENPEAARIVAENAAGSGAGIIRIDISALPEDYELSMVVGKESNLVSDSNPNHQFILEGGSNTYSNITVDSFADYSELNKIRFEACDVTPLKLYSKEVKLYGIDIVGCKTHGLLLGNDTTKFSLSGTNTVESVDENAMLSKNLNILFTNSGKLKLSGNLLICGNVLSNVDRISFIDGRGEIIKIVEDEFNKYKAGVINISLDPQGGTVSKDSLKVFYGKEIGDLPVPKRDFYTFEGWYTEKEGGELVEETTTITDEWNITLYAHWRQHEDSDWVTLDEVPLEAEIMETKWTLDSTTSTLSGFTQNGSDWKWSDYGPWSGWSDSQYFGSESREVEPLTIREPVYIDKYVYVHYLVPGGFDSDVAGSGQECLHVLDYPLNDYYAIGDSCFTNKNLGHYHLMGHDTPGKWRCVFYIGTQPSLVGYNDKTQWRYRDRSKIYTYHFCKTVSGNDTNTPSGNGITNVKKYVKYRAK